MMFSPVAVFVLLSHLCYGDVCNVWKNEDIFYEEYEVIKLSFLCS